MEWVIEDTGEVEGVSDYIELIQKAQEGNIDAFEILIDQNKGMLYRIGVNMLKSDFDTADAIQETLLIAYKRLYQLRQPQYFKTWLVKILINECKRILKNKKECISIEDETYQDIAYRPKELGDEVMTYIGLLEPKLQQVVLLKYYEGFKIVEIKCILRIPESTVKTRLTAAKKQLMILMKEGIR